MEEERNKMNECWECKSRRNVPGNAHIRCVNPDPKMVGNKHGVENGWFYYPSCFDPTWKEKDCSNYENTEAISDAVSGVVSESKPQNKTVK